MNMIQNLTDRKQNISIVITKNKILTNLFWKISTAKYYLNTLAKAKIIIIFSDYFIFI